MSKVDKRKKQKRKPIESQKSLVRQSERYIDINHKPLAECQRENCPISDICSRSYPTHLAHIRAVSGRSSEGREQHFHAVRVQYEVEHSTDPEPVKKEDVQ